jgi:chaperonin cofactor prefoldin
MPVLTDNLADEIKGLTASIHAMREDCAGWKGAVETELQLIRTLGKWILAAFTSIVIVALTGGAGLIWQAGALSAEVRLNAVQLEKRVDKVEGKIDRVQEQAEKRIDKLEGKIDRVQEQVTQLDKRMDKLEGKMDRVQEQVTQIDKRFDRLEAKLDQVLKAK